MTKIQAIVREQRLEAVIERLVMIGVTDLTMTPVRGAGRSQGRREVFRGSAYQVTLLPKVLLEWCGPDSQADAVVRAILHRAVTGKIGDGKIFVERVEHTADIGEPASKAP